LPLGTGFEGDEDDDQTKGLAPMGRFQEGDA
jgi:hypothetical protein